MLSHLNGIITDHRSKGPHPLSDRDKHPRLPLQMTPLGLRHRRHCRSVLQNRGKISRSLTSQLSWCLGSRRPKRRPQRCRVSEIRNSGGPITSEGARESCRVWMVPVRLVHPTGPATRRLVTYPPRWLGTGVILRSVSRALRGPARCRPTRGL